MPAPPPEPPRDRDPLVALLDEAKRAGYHFVTVTPETHRRVMARRSGETARDLRDVFGWSLPFEKDVLPPPIRDLLERSGMALCEGDLWRSGIRIASLGRRLFLHSAYPTDAPDSVFLGPDSYRFARFLRSELPALGPVRRLVDVGAGAGVGAITAAEIVPDARLTLSDVNPLALRFAAVNALHAGLAVEAIAAPGLAGITGAMDLVIANPPFMADAARRAYRDGGAMHGGALSLDWALEAAERLDPGGAMLLYTGSAIVGGRDALREGLEARLPDHGCTLRYAELDPDIFGEQLDEPGYEQVERIAAVGAVIRKAD